MLFDDSWLWLVIVGFIVAFVLAFGLGANDVANSFGTSVGAKVLTIRQACILGTIFETLGAVLIGAKVSNTIRKGIISPDIFTNGTEDEFIAGNVAALTGSCIWLLAATFFKLPVSGTHSIVGATIGFSVVLNGLNGISWTKLAMIAGSWFVSPLLSGLVSVGLFKAIDLLVLTKEHPLENGLLLLPIFYALTVAVNFFSVFYKGSQLLHFHKIPLYGTLILTFGSAIIVAIFVRVFIVPRQRKTLTELCNNLETDVETCGEKRELHKLGIDEVCDQELEYKFGQNTDVDDNKDDAVDDFNDANQDTVSLTNSKKVVIDMQNKGNENGIEGTANVMEEENKRNIARDLVKDKPETAGLFTFLQVITAVFGSFAHGGNDVSNAIGPVVAIWITATTGSSAQKAPVPIWILIYGGAGISVGLWVWGRRVIKTMAEDLTKITPSSGFCIEVGSALTVLVASNVGIPISTTHCKVGSVVCVGRVRSRESVDWKLFRNIILAWCVTLPISGLLSALAMFGLKAILRV